MNTSDDSIKDQLLRAGMSLPEAVVKQRLFASAAERLGGATGQTQKKWHAFYVPGRIEFLGKHTDYAGGRSLVCAVDRGFAILSVERSDSLVRIIGKAENPDVVFKIDPELKPAFGHWSNYPMTVGRRISRNFPGQLRGADIAFTSDLPASSGLSSSSALIVSIFQSLSAINHLGERSEYRMNIKSITDLAGYLGTTENGQTFGALDGDRGVGTFGGSEDHTAILTAIPGQLSQFSFCPIRHERQLPLPSDHSLVIGVSGIIAQKTGAALQNYNNASLAVKTILDCWNKTSGRNDATLAAAVAANCAGIRQCLSQPELIDRLNHFIAESTQIIPAAGDAIVGGDLGELGRLVDRSQELAARLLKNQVPETVFLAKSARECGAVAASSFGAGFGGSVWALVQNADVVSFIERWKSKYQSAFPDVAQRAVFFLTAAGVPAMQLS